MAHFAHIDDNNIVTQVITINNSEAPDEATGKTFIASLGLTGKWVQTSYNTFANVHLLGGIPFRKNYAGIGHKYDLARDAFIEPQPYPSWILDEETCQWKCPIPKPVNPYTPDQEEYWSYRGYVWNETNQSWDQE